MSDGVDDVDIWTELRRLRERVEALEARPIEVDGAAVAAELRRLEEEAARSPAAQARSFQARVRRAGVG